MAVVIQSDQRFTLLWDSVQPGQPGHPREQKLAGHWRNAAMEQATGGPEI